MEDAVLYVVKAMAGALIGSTAKDAYARVKAVLAEQFGMVESLAVLEKKPDGKTQQMLLAEELVETRALDAPEVRELMDALLTELRANPPADRRAAVLVRDIVNSELKIGDIQVEGSASLTVEELKGSKVTLGNVTVKS